jgi:hypothetical protein
MTSNVGAETIKMRAALGFDYRLSQRSLTEEEYEDMRRTVMDKLRRAFRRSPQTCGRDNRLPPLTPDEIGISWTSSCVRSRPGWRSAP